MPHPFLRSTSTLWLAIVAQVALLAVTTVVVADRSPDLPVLLPVALAASVGVAAVVAVRALERLLAATTPADVDAALAAIRARSMVQWAIGEVPVLLSMVLAFVLGPPWVVLIGAIGSLAALVPARPSMLRFGRLERSWRSGGSRVQLTRHLEGDHPMR